MRTTKDARSAADAVRKAAEAQKKKAEAAKKKPAPAAPKKAATAEKAALAIKAAARPSASAVRQAFGTDELSKGLGRALRDKSAKALGSTLPPLAIEGKGSKLTALNFRGGSAVMGPPAPAATPEAKAAQEVAKAYQQGGPEAGARAFREQTAGKTPEEAAAIAAASQPTLDKIVKDLDAKSHASDGDQWSDSADKRSFDRTVADLSAGLAVGASTPAGKQVLDHVTANITQSIKDHGIGRWDEALGNCALGGDTRDPSRAQYADTGLAVSVMESLVASGKTGEADDILQNVNASVGMLNAAIGDLKGDVESCNGDLARLVQDWGPFVQDPKDLDAAVKGFKDSHEEYAKLEQLGSAAVRVADQLSRLPASLDGLGHADDLQGSLDTAAERVVDVATLTDSGAAEFAKIQAAASKPGAEPGLIDHIADLAKQGKKGLDYLKKVSTLLVNNAVSNALASSAAGNADDMARAVSSLERFAPIFGLDKNSMGSLTDALGDVVAAGKDQEAVEGALDRLNRSLDNVKDQGVFSGSTGIGTAFRGAALVLSVGVSVGSFDKAIRDPSFESIVGAYSSAVGTGQAGVAFAKSFFESSSALAKAGNVLKIAGSIGTVLTTGLSVFQAGQAFANGDPAAGALYLVQAGAGIAALMGATGVGAIVGIGAALALAQLQKVRMSNRFEDGHTEAFLQGLGLSPEATHHLRNADSDGRSVGPVLAQIAKRLGLDPKAFLLAVGQMPPDQILNLVEACHGVDPNGDGEFRQTADDDKKAGTMYGEPPTFQYRPESVQGLIEYIKNVGLDLDLASIPKVPRPARGGGARVI